MPMYDYKCEGCEATFALRQSFTDDAEASCPKCQGTGRRRFHAVPVIYKGKGFYTTDYARGKSSTST